MASNADGPRSASLFSSAYTMERVPEGADLLEDRYLRGDRVRTYALGGTRVLYHLEPWERSLGPKEVARVSEMIRTVCHSPPATVEDYEGLRRYVTELAKTMLLASPKRQDGPSPGQIAATTEQLAEVVARYTTGFGILEHLLSDDRVEDIYVDAPCGQVPVHVTLGGVAGSSSTLRAETNIFLSETELQALITRLRYYSRRAFSEAFPVLETDVPGFESRATVVGHPLSPHGPALAVRRHSRRAWTLLRLVRNGTLSALSAGLLSFLVDGRCSMLVCGPRGAGKSSLLAAMMFEFPQSQRILTIEDTLELPVRQMQEMGFRAQSLLVDNGLDKGVDDAAEEALRVSLRLGESALIMGEVRGREAITLYESMRTGKAGSAVLGTIHGDCARSVYERVVHDMGIAPEAFGATDVVLSMALQRPQGSHRQERRLVEVAALAKERGPGEFDQIMEAFTPLEGVIRPKVAVVDRVARSWGIGYEEAVANILLRGAMRQLLVDMQSQTGTDLLGPTSICLCNDFLWERMELARSDPERVFRDFRERVAGMV